MLTNDLTNEIKQLPDNIHITLHKKLTFNVQAKSKHALS